MRIRNVVGLAVAVPGLVVALAAPGDAASRDVVTFAGRIEVRPTATAQPQTLDVCFFTLSTACANGEMSSGVAAGPSAGSVPDVVDGLQARAEYTEVCAPVTGVAPIANATLRGQVHKAASGWSPVVSAQWTRVGLVAVIQGDATGVALFTPLAVGTPCGQPVPVAIAGAVEVTY